MIKLGKDGCCKAENYMLREYNKGKKLIEILLRRNLKEMLKSGKVPTDMQIQELGQKLVEAVAAIVETKLKLFMEYLKESQDVEYSIMQAEIEFSDCLKEFLALKKGGK